jgi:hypothetical protein
MRDGGRSYVRTVVTGPGAVRFWWKVSSSPDQDFLRFRVDTTYLVQISGEQDWQMVTFPIEAGSHTVEWAYEKDSFWFDGEDAAWLDQVSFVAGPSAPYIYRPPQDTNSLAGLPVTLSATVLGTAPVHYQWQRNGINLSGANSATLGFSAIATSDAGAYQVVATNLYGAATSAAATVTVTLDPLAAALNNWQLLWQTGGFAAWDVDATVSHDGVSSARSGYIEDGQETSLATIVQGPGLISFYWRVSSETNADALVFYLNGHVLEEISGEVGWQKKAFAVPAGETSLEWVYVKDSFSLEGADSGWVDEVVFTPAPRAALPRLVGGAFAINVPSQAGRTYALEYVNNLSNTNWTTLPAVPGDGKVLTLTNNPGGLDKRFYRVKEF